MFYDYGRLFQVILVLESEARPVSHLYGLWRRGRTILFEDNALVEVRIRPLVESIGLILCLLRRVGLAADIFLEESIRLQRIRTLA